MPESVTDRPTKAHEYVFLLTKAARYFFDADAVREGNSDPARIGDFAGGDGRKSEGYKDAHGDIHRGSLGGIVAAGRNIRTVWDIATQPFSGAHFATMPPEIPRRCIKAGTSERGCCPACGAPWRRVVERKGYPSQEEKITELEANGVPRYTAGLRGFSGARHAAFKAANPDITTGWQPTCTCGAGEPVPCTVLDPFGGSGTTAAVAIEQGRNAIICELNPAYVTLARRRIQDVAPLLSMEVDA
jgi:hypothetical protein